MPTRMSRRAEMDLAEITNFIALDNPARAFEFEEELLEHARRIGCAPLAYVKRADLGAGLRSCAHGAYVGDVRHIAFVAGVYDRLATRRVQHSQRLVLNLLPASGAAFAEYQPSAKHVREH